ncbi:MAG: cupin domain-containing protein [Bacteroidetes bacterium]|jgi:mannose-6-phosphate isomerase-like protein (cupin superfamily)|nr:cupin domain-containing protein [Bacteroidota bacterium]
MEKVNLPRELAALDAFWSQKVIGQANGSLIKVARGLGETNWHKHDDQDEVFIVYEGQLTIQLRTETIELHAGELFVVPRGVEHRPQAEAPVGFVLLGIDITSTPEGGQPAWSRG